MARNILIPMAGLGSRFEAEGYERPKPLINVLSKPMIAQVVKSLDIQGRYIFIVRKEHYEKFDLHKILNNIAPNCTIIQTDKVTEGAACTTLLAKYFINNNDELIIANSDQWIKWNSTDFLNTFYVTRNDAVILTFKNSHPKWSYVKLDKDGWATEVAEKKVISDLATVGIYCWKHGQDYVKYAEQMINKNIRTNNEFYVCPVFNEAIQDGKFIRTWDVEEMYGLGTPEDLEWFLYDKEGKN